MRLGAVSDNAELLPRQRGLRSQLPRRRWARVPRRCVTSRRAADLSVALLDAGGLGIVLRPAGCCERRILLGCRVGIDGYPICMHAPLRRSNRPVRACMNHRIDSIHLTFCTCTCTSVRPVECACERAPSMHAGRPAPCVLSPRETEQSL